MRARLYYYMVTVLTRCTVAVNQSVRREFWLTLAGCFVRACLFGFGHTSHHIHHQLVLVYIHIYMYLCIYMYSNERNYVHSPCMCVSVNYDYLYGPHSKFVNVVRCWLHRPVVEFDVHYAMMSVDTRELMVLRLFIPTHTHRTRLRFACT